MCVFHGVCLSRSVQTHVPVNRANRGLEIGQLVRAVASANLQRTFSRA